ncbi:hypothetical protein PHLCEN_2v4088 [Hermanssonia centrifuga]|uniref:Uncharacterized protein n=1 Tax=Hermanssonia centrifuga TaxID=98765 RepID=A0A2R6Q2B1_9APHY|nr:hypothetical protein PHLCEN_2v4088 [Hermanssonia centrifuga]
MADGASAIIGIVAFGLNAAHKVYEVIDNIKDAPTDVLALKHDAKQIASLLLQLQELHILDSAVVPLSVDIVVLRKLFENALGEVELFIDKVAELRRDGEIRVRKLQWVLKGGRSKRLRESLRSLKTSIIAVLAASTSQSVDAVQALAIRLVEAQEQSSSNMDVFKRDHASWVAQQVAEFASLRAAIEERMAVLAYNQDRLYCMFALSPSSGVVQPFPNPGAPTAVSTPVPDIPVSEGREASAEGQSHGQSTLAPRTSRRLTAKDIKETLQCESPCGCCCHDKRLTRATPYWGTSWFGNLYLPRSFFHRSLISCNVQTCRRTQKNRHIANIKWFFPLWFVAVDMKIRLKAFPVHFCLQTPRRVPRTSPIFRCIRRMDINDVRGLLVSGEASVNDVDEVGTPLQLLQKFDSQQQQESDIGFVRPIQTHIAGPIFHEDLIDVWEDWLESCDFSDVHRAVLAHRTRNMSLKDMLSGTVADINAPCRQIGWTPLEWGIWMCIPNVVETLLESGADVHKGYPLHRAAFQGDVVALVSLVHAGADISRQDDDGKTPLHDAAYYAQDRFVEELIRIGGDNLHLDVLDHYGNTALDTARTRREYYDEMGLSISGHKQIILVLSELQASRNGRRTPERSQERSAYIESVEDLRMPGSFPME